MARFDLNRVRTTIGTRESRSAPANRRRAGAQGSEHRWARTGIPRRTNAFWFFVALFGGGAIVWWTKTAFANAWYAAVVAAGVVLTLAIYYLLNDEDAPEEEGDNVYYLGLLFTLISLMVTLVELFGADADAVRNAEKIRTLLENFGIALTSTVVGIAGRVAVQNWQLTGSAGRPEFAEDEVVPSPPPVGASSQDLEVFNRHLLGRIARDLTQGANALARFHRIVRSHASDSGVYLREHSETLKRENAAFRDTLQHDAEAFTQELKTQAEMTLATVGGALGAATKRAETLLDRIQSAQEGYLAETREVTTSFHEEIRSTSGESLDSLRRNFDAAAKQSVALTQNLTTVHDRIGESFDNLESGLRHASEASAAFGGSAEQAAKSHAVLESELEKLRTVLAALHAGAEAMKGILDAMGELDARMRAGRDTEQTAAAVQQMGETLRTVAADGAAAAEQAAKAAALFDAVTRSLQTTEGETRRAAEALRSLANEAEAQVETLRERQGSGFGFWKRRR